VTSQVSVTAAAPVHEISNNIDKLSRNIAKKYRLIVKPILRACLINTTLWLLFDDKSTPEKQQRSDAQLSERLASLGIIGAQLRVPLKPSVHHNTIVLRGLRGAFNWAQLCEFFRPFEEMRRSPGYRIIYSTENSCRKRFFQLVTDIVDNWHVCKGILNRIWYFNWQIWTDKPLYKLDAFLAK